MEVIDLVDFFRSNGVVLDKTGFGVRYSRGEAFCAECELAFDLKKLPEPYVCPVCRRRVRSRRH